MLLFLKSWYSINYTFEPTSLTEYLRAETSILLIVLIDQLRRSLFLSELMIISFYCILFNNSLESRCSCRFYPNAVQIFSYFSLRTCMNKLLSLNFSLWFTASLFIAKVQTHIFVKPHECEWIKDNLLSKNHE